MAVHRNLAWPLIEPVSCCSVVKYLGYEYSQIDSILFQKQADCLLLIHRFRPYPTWTFGPRLSAYSDDSQLLLKN